MIVKVCMGSSCHLKDSYRIVQKLEQMKQKYPDIVIYGSLCFGNCSEGVCVEIDGKLHKQVSPKNIEQIILEAKDELNHFE
ncbi:MAG TPA: NAD(P)H-dependent oxidoreductase subunit E [Pseudothermotoga sp.]|nr:NAD(P)H-dependent oxidoreductase subunit E [Pseudothermotoga sp.]HOK84091.1 NAD(P)H-dependent oxidoreductase subunit E [Pseudothermotoga sp.]HPP70558.1 NAD(P)H-dependent oxidoreductase subunit E [Pseudothermotoga sp.]